MKIVESIKRHPYRTGIATAVIAGIATAEIVGYAQNPTEDIPKYACVSPFAVSSTFVEPHTSTLFQTDSGFFTTGIVARGEEPHVVYGVQASFKSPDANASEWDKNVSSMIPTSEIGRFALKVAIGSGEVEFGVRVVAPYKSSFCDEPPEIDWQQYDRGGYFEADATLPWPNPVNVISNMFSGS